MYAILDTQSLSMEVHTMEFRAATDLLFRSVSQAELAKKLRVSVASIRQARLSDSAHAHRAPPPGWEEAVSQLAGSQIRVLQRLVTRLRARQQLDLMDSISRAQEKARSTKRARRNAGSA